MAGNPPGGVRPGHPSTEMEAGRVEPDPQRKIRSMGSFRTMEKQDQGNMEKTTVIAFFILMSTIILPAQEWGHPIDGKVLRSEEHTSELQSRGHLVCRLLLEKKKTMSHNFVLQ